MNGETAEGREDGPIGVIDDRDTRESGGLIVQARKHWMKVSASWSKR